MAEEIKQEPVKEQIETKQIAEKKDEKKPEVKVNKIKKTSAMVTGLNLSMSPKVGTHICNMIRNRNIDRAIEMLEEVLIYKRAVKMNNMEVGHRHGKGMMAGRYPQNASGDFIKLLKALKANATHNELELEKCKISECYTNVASKPYKRGGARFKRANVVLKLEQTKEEKKINSKQKKTGEKK